MTNARSIRATRRLVVVATTMTTVATVTTALAQQVCVQQSMRTHAPARPVAQRQLVRAVTHDLGRRQRRVRTLSRQTRRSQPYLVYLCSLSSPPSAPVAVLTFSSASPSRLFTLLTKPKMGCPLACSAKQRWLRRTTARRVACITRRRNTHYYTRNCR